MKAALALLVVAVVFAVGAIVVVLGRESDPSTARDRAAAAARAGTSVDAGDSPDPGRPVDSQPTPSTRDERRPPPESGGVVAAMAAMPGNRVRIGELETGVIRTQDGPTVGRVDVSTGDQRGLLGLAVDENGTTYAAYTQRQGARRIVVDKVGVGAARRVWIGPPSAALANGGHLALAPDGRLVIGIGDLGQRDRIDDPRFPNGKLLSLSVDGPATQTPRVLSSGWNNPYAFAFTPDGALWVADNAPGTQPERLARGDRDGPRPGRLRPKTAPSGLAAIDDRTVAVCGVVSQRLDRYVIERDGSTRFDGTISDGCTFGVVRRTDGTLLTSTASGLVTVRP